MKCLNQKHEQIRTPFWRILQNFLWLLSNFLDLAVLRKCFCSLNYFVKPAHTNLGLSVLSLAKSIFINPIPGKKTVKSRHFYIHFLSASSALELIDISGLHWSLLVLTGSQRGWCCPLQMGFIFPLHFLLISLQIHYGLFCIQSVQLSLLMQDQFKTIVLRNITKNNNFSSILHTSQLILVIEIH